MYWRIIRAASFISQFSFLFFFTWFFFLLCCMWGINSTGSMMGFCLPTSPLMWFWHKQYQTYSFYCFMCSGGSRRCCSNFSRRSSQRNSSTGFGIRSSPVTIDFSVLWFSFCFDLMLTRFSIYRIIEFFSHWQAFTAYRSASSGPVENILPAILMSKNIDLYNILILRSIDIITSLYALLTWMLLLTLHNFV